ncbi:MAG: flagellar biosynthesis protein FliA, partial [Acetomicrobium sp.]|nr:flagellar biosynthesis protein FliA [Acetomicrobium sp.]
VYIDEREGWLIDLERAIESLTAKEAEIIRAIDLDGLSAKEVARKRGVDISYIYRLRRRAIAKLRKILGVT